jgi:hypothetical protein
MAQNGIVAPYDDLGHPALARLTANWAFGAGAAAVSTGPGRLVRVHVQAALTSGGSATVTLYDNSAASGNALWALTVASTLNAAAATFAIDLPVFTGIYLGVSGTLTGGSLIIGYC